MDLCSDSVFLENMLVKKLHFFHVTDVNILFLLINKTYRANVNAMKKLGASSVICPCAVGSLKKEIEP